MKMRMEMEIVWMVKMRVRSIRIRIRSIRIRMGMSRKAINIRISID